MTGTYCRLEYFVECMSSELYSKWGSVKNKHWFLVGPCLRTRIFFRESTVSQHFEVQDQKEKLFSRY